MCSTKKDIDYLHRLLTVLGNRSFDASTLARHQALGVVFRSSHGSTKHFLESAIHELISGRVCGEDNAQSIHNARQRH